MTRKQATKNKSAHSQAARNKRDPRFETSAFDDTTMPRAPIRRSVEPLKGKRPAQNAYIAAARSKDLVFGVGPAGTGKTYIAGALAAEALLAGQVERIIITRPAVEAGEELGFLPGEIEDKYGPYIAAFMGVLNERLGKSYVEYLMKQDKIVAEPLAYMRGLTFRNAFVIMDEAQNATPKQMKLFLTRIGEGSKVIVNGDTDQVDIPGASGLADAVRRMRGDRDTEVCEFGTADIVRSGLCQRVVEAYATN